jgi:hypothetical protein
MCIGWKELFGGNVKLTAVNEIYALPVKVYYVFCSQLTET